MRYYRVKPEYDNVTKYTAKNNGAVKADGILVANELYTPAEYNKLCKHLNGSWMFDIIDISRKKTYWFFGARFAE